MARNIDSAQKTSRKLIKDRVPNGKPAEPGERMKVLCEKYGVAEVLRASRDEKYLERNFSLYDGILIAGFWNSLKGSGEERERMLNRMFGKVPDKQINLNVNVDLSPAALSERAQELLARLA